MRLFLLGSSTGTGKSVSNPGEVCYKLNMYEIPLISMYSFVHLSVVSTIILYKMVLSNDVFGFQCAISCTNN